MRERLDGEATIWPARMPLPLRVKKTYFVGRFEVKMMLPATLPVFRG